MHRTSTDSRTASENSQKTQQGSLEGNGGENLRGKYMSLYHEVEEMSYGPDSPLDRVSKVFLCIRHKTLRDAENRKYILKDFIQEKTGLNRGEIGKALRVLEDKEMILVHRSKTGKVWNPNQYELHPKRFGKLYNWYKNNSELAVIKGGKSYPQNRVDNGRIPSDKSIGVSSKQSIRVSSDDNLGNELKYAKLIDKIGSNNPCIKNPDTKTQKNGTDFFGGKGGIKTEEEVRIERKRYQEYLKAEGLL